MARCEQKVCRSVCGPFSNTLASRCAALSHCGSGTGRVGPTLALTGGEHMVDLLVPALREDRAGDPELMQPLADHLDRAYQSFGRLIHRFYNSRLIDNILLAPQHIDQKFRQGVISVLAADIWRDDNPFQNMLLDAKRNQF